MPRLEAAWAVFDALPQPLTATTGATVGWTVRAFTEPGQAIAELELTPDDQYELRMTLAAPSPPPVAGRVVDEWGTAVGGASVVLRHTTRVVTHTDRDSRFRLSVLPPAQSATTGPELRVVASGFAEHREPLGPGVDPSPTDLRVTLFHGARLRGRAVDPQGVPLAGIDVVVSRDSGLTRTAPCVRLVVAPSDRRTEGPLTMRSIGRARSDCPPIGRAAPHGGLGFPQTLKGAME